MVDQEKIHNQCLSNDPKERIHALEELKNFFSFISDKQQAWNDLHRLTNDKDSNVRYSAASVLGSAFSQVPDKQQAWNDLHRLTNDEDIYLRYIAAIVLGSVFSQVPDKQQAWNELIRLTYDKDRYVRDRAVHSLGSSFSQVPDKQQAWNDLLRLTNDEYSSMRSIAASVLGSSFSQVPGRQQAWNDLVRLTNDEYWNVRSTAAEALGSAFSQVPDKQQAWNDLLRLTYDKDNYVRSIAASVLGSSFSQVPDKQQAWNDLVRLTNDEYWNVRSIAADALVSAFSQVPDKQQAWNDLIQLTNNNDRYVRDTAAEALVSAFSQVPDKQQAWNDLVRLINDKNNYVRSIAADALVSAFSQVPDKQQTWNDLLRLISDKNNYVRSIAADALVSAFTQVPDKQQAWDDLIRLTNNVNQNTRVYANYFLGRVSILKASQTEAVEDYKKELEKAIKFFEIAAQESVYSSLNPSQFCLPFYRSFFTIIFKRQEAKEEVSKYLAKAKYAVKGSKSKELLLEAVENLANALNEVQNLGNLDFSEMKSELNFYRKYCDRASELMEDTNRRAPFATEVLRKGLPILDRNLKELLEEIQEKAKTACKISQGTATKEIACAVNKEIQKWEINSQEEMSWHVSNLVVVLKSKIPHNTENKEILDMIEYINYEKDLAKQYRTLSTIIGLIPTVNVVEVDPIVENINKVGQELGTKVDSLSQEMNYIRISLSPGIKQEIEISSGIEILGTGAALITTIPLQEISYAELKEDLERIKGEHISKLSELPKRLANKIKGYLLLKDREDIIEQLT